MWKQIPNEEYHSEYRSYLSSSDLRRILRSPAHYRAPQAPSSPAQEFGSLVHTFVLEPNLSEARYRARAEVDGRTKEGKSVRAREASLQRLLIAASAQQNLQFVTRRDYDAAVSIASAVRSHLGCASILAGGVAEVAGICDDFNGIAARIKPDYRTDGHIIDLKTCQDGRSDAFSRSVMTYGYAVQASWYCDIAEAIDGKKRKFYWVAVEKDAPFAVAVYEASDAMLEYGRAQYRKAIELYKECASLGLWPAYSQQVQTLELPAWVKE